MKLVNLTPHTIVIQTTNGILTIPPSGTVARCATTAIVAGNIRVDDFNIPINATQFGDITGLPDPTNDVIYVASSLVAQRAGRADVLAPDTGPSAIRDDKGQIIAVTALQTFV